MKKPDGEKPKRKERPKLNEPLEIESRRAGLQYPLPLDSLKAIRKQLERALAGGPRSERQSTQEPELHAQEDREDRNEGPSRLAHAFDRLRLYAYPKDRADWNTLNRAKDHRQWMRSGRDSRFRASILGTLGVWEFIGPQRFDTGGGHWVSGRVNAIAIDPKNNGTLYAGAAGGGVWRTRDWGVSWKPLSDSWPYEEVASIAIDPKDTAVIYVGTGDFHAWSTRHFGLMKSTDSGESFVNLPAGEASETSISGIVVDPDDPQIVMMCGGRGRTRDGYVWRSIDGGVSWNRAVNIAAEWAKIVMGRADASGKRPVYAVGWNGGGGVMHRSRDRGVTWEPLTPPWGSGQWGISVATSPLDPARVYVMAGQDRMVYTSADYGDNWTDVTDDLRRDDFEWGQLWYDWDLACGSSGGTSPHDVLFLGLLHLNFWDSSKRAWVGVPHGHDDIHVIAVDSKDPNRFLLGNDGGVYELVRIANGWSLTSLNATLGITECYRGHASLHDPRICLAATQDNAVASSQTDLTSWGQVFPPTGGDAIATMVSPVNPQVQFVEGGVAFWGIGRTTDGWASKVEITPPAQADVRDPFSMPLAMDSGGSSLYWGTDYLWIRDETSGAWNGHVGGQRLVAGNNEAVKSLGVAPSNRDRVYTGSTDGQLWMGQGPNWSWTQIDAGLPDRLIAGISVHPTNPNDVVVALGGTGTGHIWRCRDTSAQPPIWDDISGSGGEALPDIPSVGIARDPRNPSEILYAGTDVGVFMTDDSGNHWADLTLPHGLPSAQLTDLQLVGRSLYAVLFGRGVWRLRLPITETTPASASIGSTLFIAATSIDGRILLSQARFGQAGSPWWPIAGNGRTDAPVSLASIQNTLFVFCKGLDGRIYVNQAELTTGNSDPEKFAQSFSGWFEVQGGGQTDTAPAAVRLGQSVFVFIKGLDQRIYLNQAEYRHAFSGWFELQGNGLTDAAPTCATVENVVFCFIKGMDGRIYVNQAEYRQAFSGWFEVQGNGLTDTAPAATSIQRSVFVFIKGLNGRVYVNQAELGHAFSGWFELQGNGYTERAPAASSVLQSVFCFILSNNRIEVNQAEYRHAFSGWFPTGDDAA